MINAKLQSIIDTKSAIGNAIVNKGGTITGETPFFNYAAQIDGISTGTPQTIFAASDGSKWALSNVVNLVNSAGNVTYDFNRWQPANNSTSDPILNIGTVNGNISGNIKIVQVNQVNIAQYGNIVASAPNGAKYVGYNGYDAQTNPTPTGNTTFNRWLLNNSATGTVIFANATIVSGGTFNGPNSSLNEANMAFIGNTGTYNSSIFAVVTNNGFVYAGGGSVINHLSKHHESNLVFVANSASMGDTIEGISINNGSLFVVSSNTSNSLRKYFESNLAQNGVTSSPGRGFLSVTTNNSFVFAGTSDGFFANGLIRKYHESNLGFIANSANLGSPVREVKTNNGFIFGVGNTAGLRKYHESNLVLSSNVSFNGLATSVTTNNGFVYVGGGDGAFFPNGVIRKYHESNLGFISEAILGQGQIFEIKIKDNFIYASGNLNTTVRKFHESNLSFVGNTVNSGGSLLGLALNNGFIYAGGETNTTIRKYQTNSISLETLSFFNITTIKE